MKTLARTLALLALAPALTAQVNYNGAIPWIFNASSGPDAQVPGWWYNLGITQTRIAANSFIEMSRHLEPEDPLRQVALEMADALLGSLEGPARGESADRGGDGEIAPAPVSPVLLTPRPSKSTGPAIEQAEASGDSDASAAGAGQEAAP